MKTTNNIKRAIGAFGIVGGLLFASSASASVLQGEFSLTSDSDFGVINGVNIGIGTIVGAGEYITEDLSNIFVHNEAGANGIDNQFAAITLASFEFNDIFGNTFSGGSDLPGNPNISAPFAVLDAVGGPNSGVDFLVGVAFLGGSALELGFGQDGVTGEFSLTQLFRVSGGGRGPNFAEITVAAGNQVQVVPEPTSLALLGIGAFSLGVFRKRQNSKP